MQNNIYSLSERRAAIPYEKRTKTASEDYANNSIEVITLYADQETVKNIMRCLGYPQP